MKRFTSHNAARTPASGRLDWLWALAIFAAFSAYCAATQPVFQTEAAGGEGQALHAMAKALPKEWPAVASPFGHRPGLPLAVAAVAKSRDWVISAGFDRLNFWFNLLSVVLLWRWLRDHVPSRAICLALVTAFIAEPHSPVRLSYVHPVSAGPATMTLLLAGLVGIRWFEQRPHVTRAAALTVLVSFGVLVHEAVLLIAVCLLLSRCGTKTGASWRARMAALDRSGAWLPLGGGVLTLVALHAWIEPVPADYSRIASSLDLLSDKSAPRYLLSWFLVFGVLLLPVLAAWRHSLRVLLRRPAWLVFVVACAAGALAGDARVERTLAFATPVVLMLAGRAMIGWTAAPMLVAAFVLQAVSSRLFTPIGGPIETPVVLGEVWERVISARVSWALSYPNMWSHLAAPELLPACAVWFGACAIALWLVGRATGAPSGASSYWPPVQSAMRRWSRSAGSRWTTTALVVAAGVAPIAWLSVSPFYEQRYAEAGASYAAYNVARIWLVVALILVFWSTGRRFNERWSAGHSGGALDAAFAGAALWSVFIVSIAAMHLYYAPLVLVVFAAALAIALVDASRAAPDFAAHLGRVNWSFTTVTLAGLVVVHVAAILLGIVLWGHPGGDNDVPGNYLPYYDTVLRNHSIAPNHYWVHFFASKGNGLGFLANALSDVQGAGLVTFAVILMGGALVGRASLAAGVPLAIALLLVCVYLQFFGAQGAYAKSHIIRNTLIVYLVISAAEWLRSGAREQPLTPARLAAITAVLVMSPLAVLILLPIVLIPAMLALASGRGHADRVAIEPVWTVVVTTLVCAYNYFHVGLFELHSMPSVIGRLVDFRRLSEWLDPRLAYMDYRLGFVQAALPSVSGTASTVGVPPTEPFVKVLTFLVAPATALILAAAVIVFLVAGLRRGSGGREHRHAGLALASMLAALCAVAGLRMFGAGPDSSMGRFTAFGDPLALAAAGMLIVAAWQLARPAGRVAIGALLVAAGSAALVTGWRPVAALPWRSSLAFAIGRTSYAAMHEPAWGTLTAVRVAKEVPAGARVEMLNFMPGFTAIPQTPFQRPDGTVYLPQYTTMVFASADESARLYADHGIRHFLFDVTPGTTTVWSGFGDLFSPDNIRARMRVVAHIKSPGYDVYLTTWRSEPGSADESVETLASRWADKLAFEKTSGLYYSSFAATRQYVSGH